MAMGTKVLGGLVLFIAILAPAEEHRRFLRPQVPDEAIVFCSIDSVTIANCGEIRLACKIHNNTDRDLWLPRDTLDNQVLDSIRFWPVNNESPIRLSGPFHPIDRRGTIKLERLPAQSAVEVVVKWDPCCPGFKTLTHETVNGDVKSIRSLDSGLYAVTLNLVVCMYSDEPKTIQQAALASTSQSVMCINTKWVDLR